MLPIAVLPLVVVTRHVAGPHDADVARRGGVVDIVAFGIVVAVLIMGGYEVSEYLRGVPIGVFLVRSLEMDLQSPMRARRILSLVPPSPLPPADGNRRGAWLLRWWPGRSSPYGVSQGRRRQVLHGRLRPRR